MPSKSHITQGSLWVCKMKLFDTSPDDIYAKVLKVGEYKVLHFSPEGYF